MELKHADCAWSSNTANYQSNHHGIETMRCPLISHTILIYQSNHHGIETWYLSRELDNHLPINRTIMELKPGWYLRIAIGERAINRTIMELKPYNLTEHHIHVHLYQSNHHGIETCSHNSDYVISKNYQSNHHGIETCDAMASAISL